MRERVVYFVKNYQVLSLDVVGILSVVLGLEMQFGHVDVILKEKGF